VVLAACHDAAALGFASDELRANREFILKVVRKSGWALTWAGPRFRYDRPLVQVAVEQNGYVLECIADESLQKDPELQRAADMAKGSL